MIGCVCIISLSVVVLDRGQKALYILYLGALHPLQLTDLNNQLTLDLLTGLLHILHVGDRYGIGEPFGTDGQFGEQSRLPNPLRAADNGHIVEFYRGAEHPPHQGNQGFTGHCPDIRIIFSAQVVDQQGVNPFLAVPHLCEDIVLHRMVVLLGGDNRIEGCFNPAEETVGLFHIAAQVAPVQFCPLLGVPVPRKMVRFIPPAEEVIANRMQQRVI